MSELASRASLAAMAWTARLGIFCRPGRMTSVDNSWVTPVTTPDRPTVAVEREPMLRVHWVWVSALVVVLGLLYAWQLQPGKTLRHVSRAMLTPGRPVFAPGERWACDLAGAGFEIEPYTEHLFRVLPPATGTSPPDQAQRCDVGDA